MLKDTVLEVKRTRKTGSGIPFDKFLAHEQAAIKKILFDFWGIQAGTLTAGRVSAAIQNLSFPADLLDDLNGNLETMIETQLKPLLTNAVSYAGNGTPSTPGMIDSINAAAGSNLLFSSTTQQTLDFISREGGRLITGMTDSQVTSIRNLLSESIRNDWGINRTVTEMKRGITLTPRESRSITNVYDRTYEKELARFQEMGVKNPASRARANAERAAAKKTRFLQNSRARRITETELKRAKEFANQEAHRQAIRAGAIKSATKTWRRGNFKDNWDSSIMYDGKKVQANESFARFGTPAKTSMSEFGYPAEINEKCSLEWSVEK